MNIMILYLEPPRKSSIDWFLIDFFNTGLTIPLDDDDDDFVTLL